MRTAYHKTGALGEVRTHCALRAPGLQSGCLPLGVQRMAGSDRFERSVLISEARWFSGPVQ